MAERQEHPWCEEGNRARGKAHPCGYAGRVFLWGEREQNCTQPSRCDLKDAASGLGPTEKTSARHFNKNSIFFLNENFLKNLLVLCGISYFFCCSFPGITKIQCFLWGNNYLNKKSKIPRELNKMIWNLSISGKEFVMYCQSQSDKKIQYDRGKTPLTHFTVYRPI